MYIVGCHNFTKTSKNNDTNCLSETSRKTLSMALVQCHFDYSCSSWYEGVCKSLRNKLQVMQNKTVRFVKISVKRERFTSSLNKG